MAKTGPVEMQSPTEWLSWICESQDPTELRYKYDQWATKYNENVVETYGQIPRRAAEMLVKHLPEKQSAVLDVGAGTGLVGAALATHCYTNLVAADLSDAMLDVAKTTGAYQSYVRCAIGDGCFQSLGPFHGIISAGVFSVGQAGPSELKAINTKILAGGIIVLTAQRAYMVGSLQETLAELAWTLLESEMLVLPGYADAMGIYVYRVKEGARGSHLQNLASSDDGLMQLINLENVNADLERKLYLSRDELRDMGILRESQEPVSQLGSDQSIPFSRLYLPIARQGVLEPHRQVSEIHVAIQILLPGCGTTFSVAETLVDIAGKFHGKSSNKRSGDRRNGPSSAASQLESFLAPSEDTFRVASFPMDLPLNGMGSNAPSVMFSERGLVAVIRHAHLVLSRLYPGRPVFVGGRSQGGAAAIMYAQHYGDVSGVIAMNPPHPDPELHQYSVDWLESKADVLAEELHAPGMSLHEPSWQAYKSYTPLYQYPGKKTLAPTMILLSMRDPCNKFPKYPEMLGEFASGSDKREMHTFEANHNLWDRRGSMYDKVIDLQSRFIMKHLEVEGDVATLSALPRLLGRWPTSDDSKAK
eukprot:TRINITY_DN17075_c0_g1_i1.p1 TRINITY_DN17075_c0_g1~~TRINITY_DN17075_c0_g1_i1.p1  ORF type:complete len:588 (-),score=66.22 TRINITY_DN17075_c0_g1_i1:6-1769(-)